MAAPFRFRDLPAEMRNRIIAFAVLEPEPIELYNVSPPAITAVSRQLRVESLAVFFWENTFLVRVYSDVGYHFLVASSGARRRDALAGQFPGWA
jgi:hypothetical protein